MRRNEKIKRLIEMNEKFKNKYRIETTRLKGWDYGKNGYYFVTICTKDRIPYFGDVINGMVQLSEIGKIAFDELQKTPEIRKDMNVTLGEFVIMPNHIHCIIIIGENEYNNNRGDAMRCDNNCGDATCCDNNCKDAMRCDNNCRVETPCMASLRINLVRNQKIYHQ